VGVPSLIVGVLCWAGIGGGEKYSRYRHYLQKRHLFDFLMAPMTHGGSGSLDFTQMSEWNGVLRAKSD